MIIARLHRGGLAESMETANIFESVEEMKQWFVDVHENAFNIEDVVVGNSVAYDKRNGWNTRYVCTKRYFNEDYVAKWGSPQCIGMCDLDYNH